MEGFKHTPAPWFSEGQHIATVIGSTGDNVIDDANTALIAKSTELLETLQWVLDAWGCQYSIEEANVTYNDARALIQAVLGK